MLCVANNKSSLIITGNGDVIEPEDGLMAIGSGGAFAKAAASALLLNTTLDAQQIVEKSLNIASNICIFTNSFRTIEVIEWNN
jgi:ATP-dependent HslUV protease, peptidase subunit HslV